jgi:uncharacterized protein YpmS
MRLILILAVLVLAGLACNFPGSATSLPPTAKPMSTEEVQTLEDQLKKTLEQPNTAGEIVITITQDQVNRMVTGEIQKQPDLGISDSSLIMTGGNIEVYGKVTQNNVSANLKVVMRPQIDGNGNPNVSIISMSLGGLPVPDVFKEKITTMANNALASYLSSSNPQFKAKSITISEGQMTITGTPQ